MAIEEIKRSLRKIIERYDKHKDDKSIIGNEDQVGQNFIKPLIRDVLHWDIEDPSQFRVEESRAGKRRDFATYSHGITQFIIEAKAANKDLFEDVDAQKQALEYGYNAGKDFVILTNFKHFIVLSPTITYKHPTEAAILRINLLTASDADLKKVLCFEREYWLSSGRSNELYQIILHHKKAIPVDERLLDDMKRWRELLLTNIQKHNPKLHFDDELEEIEKEVQKFVDRLVFICYCEDKEIHHEPMLKQLLHEKSTRYDIKPGWLLEQIRTLFAKYRKVPDSDLFDVSMADKFVIDDAKLISVLTDLRTPTGKPPYNFDTIDIDILGKTYENFIGHVQMGKKRFKEKDDISKRKKEGIYYTPKYIVDYIVNNTVRDYIKNKSFEEIKKLRILDPACGSGSFLLKAFDVLSEESEKKLKRKLDYEEKKELMLNCVYGVDLDERAVEIAKLNLSLKMAERGESLPLLRSNIKHGNSLIDDEKVAGYKAFVWKDEFKEIMQNGGFDVVIGNPPYVRIQTLDEKNVDYFNTHYKTATKNYDIYALFVEKGLSLLKEEGALGFILPSKFFNADYGAGLRKVIADNNTLYKIVDFKDFQVFENATTYTCLLFLKKTKNKNFEYLELSNKDGLNNSLRTLMKLQYKKSIQAQPLEDENWNFVGGDNKSIIEELKSIKLKLGDISENLFQGIITGSDKIFILVRKNNGLFYSSETNKEYDLEKELLHPLLKGSKHIRRYRIEPTEKFVIFPYKLVNDKAIPISEEELQKKFSKIYSYLHDNKTILQKRDGGKMKGDSWYIYSRNQNLARFGQDKIMTPSIAKFSSFTYDKKSDFFFVGSGGGGGGAYGITLKDKNSYLYTLAILNSKLVSYFIRNTSSKFSGGYLAFNRQYIEEIPIIIPSDKEKLKLAELAKKQLGKSKKLSEFWDKKTSESAKLQEEIKKTDIEIDEIVYNIYGITTEGKKIIEESLSNQ